MPKSPPAPRPTGPITLPQGPHQPKPMPTTPPPSVVPLAECDCHPFYAAKGVCAACLGDGWRVVDLPHQEYPRAGWWKRLTCPCDRMKFVIRKYADYGCVQFYDHKYACPECGRTEYRPGSFPRPTAPG